MQRVLLLVAVWVIVSIATTGEEDTRAGTEKDENAMLSDLLTNSLSTTDSHGEDSIILSPLSGVSSVTGFATTEEDPESILDTKQIHQASTIDPSRTVVKGSINHLIAGVVGNFTITPYDHNGNAISTANLQLLLRHNMSEKHSRFVTRCEKQFCIVYYLCIEAGSYFMNLLLDDEHIGGSPFQIQIHPNQVDARRTFAMALDKQGKPIHPLLRRKGEDNRVEWRWKAGEENLFTINPRDSYGNKVFDFNYRTLSFSHNLSISAPLKMKSEILYDGRLKVVANTTSTLPFQLSIAHQSHGILNSPIDISVEPSDVCSECSMVQGVGLLDSRVGVQSEIQVLVRDQWGNLTPEGFVSATCHSPNCSLAVENHHNGSFSVLFTPYKKEKIQLSVRVNGFPIVGSPFQILVKGKQFPLPPLLWYFLGPFDWEECQRGTSTSLMHLGLCDYPSFRNKVTVDMEIVYPSTIIKGGKVSWRTTRVNATGYARIKTTGSEFFGWAVGKFNVEVGGTYNVFCEGIYEYYINDIAFAGGSWHTVILEDGIQEMTLLLSSMGGIGDFRCEFMPGTENESNWPVDTFIDVSSLPGDQSWFSMIQLVILFKCLEAILGPMYYRQE